MGDRKSFRSLRAFDRPFQRRYGRVAGVDEVGRGPLAGPVVAAAIILPEAFPSCSLNDSKRLSPSERARVYALLQRHAVAIGVGIVEPTDIDRLNILRASQQAMRLALHALICQPRHLLVDGYAVPDLPAPQTSLIAGDSRSASIAAASIIAKVTRDAMMRAYDRQYPGYGFAEHKGYGTALHLEQLRARGATPIHRRSFQPVYNLVQPTFYEAAC
jgi:ribonuclease HII